MKHIIYACIAVFVIAVLFKCGDIATALCESAVDNLVNSIML